MSLEEGNQPSTLIKKRSYDTAFLSSRAAIESVLPHVSKVVQVATGCLQRCFAGLTHYFTERLDIIRDEQKHALPLDKKKRRKVRQGETSQERDMRRALRRLTRKTIHTRAHKEDHTVDPSSPTPHLPLRDRQLPFFDTVVDQSLSGADLQTKVTTHHARPRGARTSIRVQYRKTLESCHRLPFRGHDATSVSTSSPLHRSLFASTPSGLTRRSSALGTRTPKDATNILNRITPHKSRIAKNYSHAQPQLPFTRNLSQFLQSPAQSSPLAAYRSPGAPLGSPESGFNMFRTKGDQNKAASRKTDDESLEQLIAQLRREHPHQYEWQKIDKERAARDQEIARKRALLSKPVRVAIPTETAKRVEKALHGHVASNEILVEKFNQEIRAKDLSTLRHGEWLNDEVINFYMNLIVERSRSESKTTLHAFNTFFYTKLTKSGYKDVRRWAKKAKVDIAKCDLVLVPVHLGIHWCMAAINAREKRFEYWDSLKGGAGQAFSALREYMQNEAPSVDISHWDDWIPESGPQQRNGNDCGVFACQTAESLSRLSDPTFSQDEMPELRKRMAASILDAKIY